jgi:hypothetical protein
MRVNAIEKWVTKHATTKEIRITTRCVAVPTNVISKEQFKNVEELNQILVHVVVGHGMKEHSTAEIYETFRLRNKINKFGVDFVRQEVEREKKHKSFGTRKQVRIFSVLVDRDAMKKLIGIAAYALNTQRLKAKTQGINVDQAAIAFCYKACLGRVALQYRPERVKKFLENKSDKDNMMPDMSSLSTSDKDSGGNNSSR